MLACLFEFFFFPLALFPIYMSFSFFNVRIENLLFSFSMCFLFLSGGKKEILRTVVTCCQIKGSLSPVF